MLSIINFSVSKISGEGILDRQTDDGTGNDRWTLTKVTTNSDAVVFEDGLIVTAGSNTSEVTEKTEGQAIPAVTPLVAPNTSAPATETQVAPSAPTH